MSKTNTYKEDKRMSDFTFTMICYGILLTVIIGAIIGEIVKSYIYSRDYKNRLLDNQKRVWENFVRMGN